MGTYLYPTQHNHSTWWLLVIFITSDLLELECVVSTKRKLIDSFIIHNFIERLLPGTGYDLYQEVFVTYNELPG